MSSDLILVDRWGRISGGPRRRRDDACEPRLRGGKRGCGCCGGGVFGSVGAVLAALLSWKVNQSLWWALLHAFFSWFYVIYHWLSHGELLP